MLPDTGPLYPGPDSLVFNNYPPGGFLVVGALGRFVFGDMIVAGRAVALASLLAVAGLVGLVVRQLGGTRRAAVAAGFLMLLLAATAYRRYVAMDDPQWLAQAVMTGGLAVLLRRGAVARLGRREPLPAGPVAGSAVLMAAGGLIKHDLVALPIAAMLWLGLHERRAAWWFAAAAAVALLLAMAATAAAFGHAPFADILGHRRVIRVGGLLAAADATLPLVPVVLIVAARSWRRRPDTATAFPALFAAVALVTGVAQRLGEGVNYNAQFELLVALSVAFGVALRPAAASARPVAAGETRSRDAAVLCAFAASWSILSLPHIAPAAWRDVVDRHNREAAWRPVIARLAGADGPVACEMQSLCTWAGRPFTVDVFNLTEDAVAGGAGRAPIATFERLAASDHFALFEVEQRSATHRDARRAIGRDPVLGALAPSYRTVLTGPDDAALLAPSTPFPPPSSGGGGRLAATREGG